MTNVERAAELLNGNVWERNGKLRVYLKPAFKRNQKAFIDFDHRFEIQDDSQIMDEAKLCVFTDCPNQPTAWNVSQSKQLKHKYAQEIAQITGQEVCENWQDMVLV